MILSKDDRVRVDLWVDGAGQVLSGSVTVTTGSGEWRSAVVTPAGPFDDALDLLHAIKEQFERFYGPLSFQPELPISWHTSKGDEFFAREGWLPGGAYDDDENTP